MVVWVSRQYHEGNQFVAKKKQFMAKKQFVAKRK